jgi:hypothetical protein
MGDGEAAFRRPGYQEGRAPARTHGQVGSQTG